MNKEIIAIVEQELDPLDPADFKPHELAEFNGKLYHAGMLEELLTEINFKQD